MKLYQLALVACAWTAVVNAKSTAECMEAFSISVDNLDHSSVGFCDAISDYASCLANDGGPTAGYLKAAASSLLKVHQDTQVHCGAESGASSPSVRTINKDLHLSVPQGHTVTIGRGVKVGAKYGEDVLDLFDLSTDISTLKTDFEATQGKTGIAATLRAEIEVAVSKAVNLANDDLETAKGELSASSAVQAKVVQDLKGATDATLADLTKTVNVNKAAAAAALNDASKANVKARAVISDGVKEMAATLDSVLECNAERKLYNATNDKCIDVLPPPPPNCGADKSNPCKNCAQTLDEGQATGKYWILPPKQKAPFQAYCDNSEKGGGWMLIVKIKRDQDASQPRWHWNSDLWKSTNVLNEDQANDTPGDYKNRAYSQMPFSKIRFVLGPKLTGGLVEDSLGGEQSSARSLFNGGYKRSKFSRNNFIGLVAPYSGGNQWNNQPNCNRRGFNLNEGDGQHRCRWGISMNNENNCGSNDASIGFGCFSNSNCCSQRRFGAGGSRWSGDRRFATAGWILIK